MKIYSTKIYPKIFDKWDKKLNGFLPYRLSVGLTTDFVSVWRTTGVTETITLPATGTNNFVIDWGDGSAPETITTASPSHEYAVADDYTVRISGTCPKWFQNNAGDKDKLIRVLNLGVVGWTELNAAFHGCSNLIEFVVGGTDTSACTSMLSMMRDWPAIVSTPNLIGLDTSACVNMGAMMRDWTSVISPPDLTDFDTSVCTNMSYMLYGWSSMTSPPDLRNFDTSLCTNMTNMVRYWTSMGDIGDIGVELFDVAVVVDLVNFAASNKFATATYDKILANWSAQTLQSAVSVHFGTSTYTDSTSRDVLTDPPNSWVITDGGAA